VKGIPLLVTAIPVFRTPLTLYYKVVYSEKPLRSDNEIPPLP